MYEYPPSVQKAIGEVARLPGIGRRSAERIVLALLREEERVTGDLAEALMGVRSKIRHCSRCGNLCETDPCPICTDSRRDQGLICVVEEPRDIISLEKSGSFRGVYHALMGKIAPLDGVEAEDLRIGALIRRVREQKPEEVILALGTDIEGETTALYTGKLLKEAGVSVTRIAYGISAGMGLEHADSVTLSRALEGRRHF
ncbi:MAG: recombination mediator RecR [Verrucomicrobiae bacterium]|nr:recombination mediator RecR [Verrucomicrobiae bacterium]